MFSCVYEPSVCFLSRNVYLGLLPNRVKIGVYTETLLEFAIILLDHLLI